MNISANKKISIITINYNSKRYLEQTISSVASQSYSNKEYIIIDGGSTDGTLEIIKKHESKIDCWISEPDDGIADAMNKGVELATGDYILFLHSDDYLLALDVLEKAAQYLVDPYEIIMFSIILEHNSKKSLARSRGLNWWINFKTGVFHQSTFCSKKLFQKIGRFDTKFKITMDYDFFLRAYRARVSTRIIDKPLSVMRLVGISSQKDWPSLRKRFHEERRVHDKNNNSKFKGLLYTFYWIIYLTYRWIGCHCNSLSGQEDHH